MTLFELEHNLCTLYPALSPFELDNIPFSEVIELFADVRTMQIHDDKESEEPPKVIRRPAGDNWF